MYRDKDGNPQGFEVEMARGMCKTLGVKCTFIDNSFENLLPGIQAGKFDVVIASMSITPERAKVIDFCKPFEAAGLVVNVPEKSPLGETSDENTVVAYLNKSDKKVAVNLGSTSEQAKQRFFPNAQTVYIQNPLDGFLQVMTGRADANIRDDVTTFKYLHEHPSAFKVALDGRQHPFLQIAPAGGGVPRGQEEMCHWIDIWVQTWIDSGDYRKTYLEQVGWEPPLQQLQILRGGF